MRMTDLPPDNSADGPPRGRGPLGGRRAELASGEDNSADGPPRGAGPLGDTPLPDARGHFGPYGGVFVAETLVAALDDLKAQYAKYRDDRRPS